MLIVESSSVRNARLLDPLSGDERRVRAVKPGSGRRGRALPIRRGPYPQAVRFQKTVASPGFELPTETIETTEDRELTALIREEAERIGALVSRVEQFGEIAPGRFLPVNIHDVLDRACRVAKAGFAAQIRFILEYDPSLPPTLGDSDQLMQVLLNLLKNAAEAVPEAGGIIIVRSSYRAGMKVATPTGRRESLPLQITITDNGSGVPEDLLRHIFEPFVTAKSGGRGLGLALVSKIISDHGGVIACESEPGRTQFRLLLPVAPALELPEAGPPETATAPDAVGGEDAA